MCKRKTHRIDMPMLAAEGAYEGRTVRLNHRDDMPARRSDRGCAWHVRFPWWTLWLIWPLIGLAKWFVPLYIGVVTAALTELRATGAAPIVASILILAGLVLIARK
ncbi:MAG TPA: hypothetical protein VFU22_27125 [Roseiflexaceae bacterium]|nr:hypothetical protein [Roseiflexaceae bacterium]